MILKLESAIYIEVPDDADVDGLVMDFESGADSALDAWPKGSVIQVDIEGSEKLTPEAVKEMGFEDE